MEDRGSELRHPDRSNGPRGVRVRSLRNESIERRVDTGGGRLNLVHGMLRGWSFSSASKFGRAFSKANHLSVKKQLGRQPALALY